MQLDLKDSLAISKAIFVHTYGYKGRGINVAVWECGPDDTTNLVIREFYDKNQSCKMNHARLTNAIISNRQTIGPWGYAPDCRLYSANSTEIEALTWAILEKNCTIISQSFHRSTGETSPDLIFDDIYKDYLVLIPPFPFISQAAGNIGNLIPPTSEYVNHKGFNSFTVGNHSDDAKNMSGTTTFRNPNSPNGDRELPTICANGIGVSAVQLTGSGTSFSAPAVAGIAACLQERDRVLTVAPEGIRAILLAGATINVSDTTWWESILGGIDALDGTGAVNAFESLQIAGNRQSPNNSPSQKGWYAGQFFNSDFDPNNNAKYVFNIKMDYSDLSPIEQMQFFRIPFIFRIKVALTWNSEITWNDGPISSELTADFDLEIYDKNNNFISGSHSLDNNYEIAEFNPILGEEYKILIHKSNGNYDGWYGIAWTFRRVPLLFPIKGILPFIPN